MAALLLAMSRSMISKKRNLAAFSLIEITVCVGILSVMFVSLYGGIASGFGLVNLARENLRANQIIVEKMETIRLYNWDQINSNNFIPKTFTAPFFPTVNSNSAGLIYHGTLNIADVPFENAYSTNLRLVSVSLTWTNSNIPRVRELKTLVSRNGLQNYIYY